MSEWEWSEPFTSECAICGRPGSDRELRLSLLRWKRPVGGPEYEHGIRCKDERSCRERVTAAGREWPLAGRMTA